MRGYHMAVAGVIALGAAGCGDSEIVKACREDGNSAEMCLCADRIMRDDLTAEEYKLTELAARKKQKAVQKRIEKKGPAFGLTYATKMAGVMARTAQECAREK